MKNDSFQDSIVVRVPRENDPYREICGPFLGDLVDEIPESREIECFIAGGPKQYAYRTHDAVTHGDEKDVVKIRGLTLDTRTGKQLTLPVLRRMVEARSTKTVVTERTMFRRDHRGVFTRVEQKKYRLVSSKNVRRDDDSIVPFGYLT